jgi:Spy/CpxP family protein refolding chaperone
MKAQLKIVSALILGGLIACTSIAGAAEKQGERKGAAGQERMDAMTKDLNLTAEQKTKVRELMEKEGKEMRAMRDQSQNLSQQERRDKMMERRKAMDGKMKEILKPEQYEKWLQNRQNRPETPGAQAEGKKKGEENGKGKGKGKKNK